MKVQYMAIIFIVIMLPIILVLSLYMQTQLDNLTVNLQYDAKLFEATADGIEAFELNTVNNRFSQIADSEKRDVEAGVNTFLTSLANNLGLSGQSRDYFLPYIPAILFTMYDGYYIYSPTYAEVLVEDVQTIKDLDGRDITVKTEKSKVPGEKDSEGNVLELEPGETIETDANGKTITTSRDHLLKPYIYYTTRYVSGLNTDFIVNYTLDNYIIVYGNINGQYVTRSGFLSAPENIDINFDSQKLDAILARKILNYLLAPRELDNMSQEEILNRYRTIDLSPLKDTTTGETKSAIAEVSLVSEIGKTLYEAMTGESRSISSLSKNDILEALLDTIVDEQCEIDRNVTEEILARQILGYVPGIDANIGSQAAILSTFKYVFGDVSDLETFMSSNVTNRAERENRTIEVQSILGAFNKNNFGTANSLDELLDKITQNIEDENVKNESKTNIKNYIKSTTGVALVEEMLANKSLSELSDNELFKLISGRSIYYEGIGENLMVDEIKANDGSIIDETIDIFTVDVTERNTNTKLSITDADAKRYYVKSLRFSNWVNANLGNVEERNAVSVRLNQEDEADVSGLSTYKSLFPDSTKNIFKTNRNNDPDKEDSDFEQHRMNCIIASIQTNLNTAISQYNQDFFQKTTYSLTMPIMNSAEWYKITNNVSMVSFLQGIQVGSKIYNDYAVVSSNKNIETINQDDVFYINTADVDADGIAYYHRSDCKDLKVDGNLVGLKNIDYDIYKDEDNAGNIEYSFGNALLRTCANTNIEKVYGCYHCIVSRNYEKNSQTELENINRLTAMYNAVAREKNNLYKVNQYYNVDILSEYVAPPTTVTGTLFEKVNPGDYVKYNPNGNYGQWRVLRKIPGDQTVELVSEASLETIALSGNSLLGANGYETFVRNLEARLKAVIETTNYVDSRYASFARILGSDSNGNTTHATQDIEINDVTYMKEGNTLALPSEYSGGYWLLSAADDGDGYSVMYVSTENGILDARKATLTTIVGSSREARYGVRVVVKLNAGVNVTNQDQAGSKTNPWELSL